jgi:hypothetical protein
LSASQIIGLGTVMAVTLTISDIPAGVWSDTFSRKWPLVVGHGFLAAGMLRQGVALARRDREILLVLAATMMVNGAGMIGWLFARRLVELGLPGAIRLSPMRRSGFCRRRPV